MKIFTMSNKNRLFEIMQRVNPDFKRLDEKNPEEYDSVSLIETLSLIADEIHQPKPTSKLDTGSSALVFNTTDPNILIRVELIDDADEDLREYTLTDPDIQETGGVVQIYHIAEYELNDENYLISWKEKIETNYQYLLYRKYEDDELSEILHALDLYNLTYGFLSGEGKEKQLNTLKYTTETNKLYNAVMAGLPTNDISHDTNIGLNSKGDIVAFDV